MSKMSIAIAAGALALSWGVANAASEVNGAGASFPYPVYSKWSSNYNKATGVKINYQSIGSSGGIAQIKAKTVTFGASDKPLSPKKLSKAGLAQFPMVVGGIVPVVNVKGVGAGQMRFNGELLGDILMGKITRWNDPAIRRLNPGLALPNQKITVVHRADGSGTTYNFTYYLSQVNPEWHDKIGKGKAVKWPTGVGGKGNEGVANYVKRIRGAIGYVEYAYAKQNNLAYGAMINAAGKTVLPSLDTFQAAANTAQWDKAEDYYLIMTNAPGDDAWPIAAATFILMYKQPGDAAASKEALKFFKWALENGQNDAESLGYVPLPAELSSKIQQYWAKNIKVEM